METASKTVAERWSRRKEKSTTGSQRFSRVKQQKESVWNASDSLGASETTCLDEEGAASRVANSPRRKMHSLRMERMEQLHAMV